MRTPLSAGAKLTILIILALIFGATMVGLSLKPHIQGVRDFAFSGNDKEMTKSFQVKPDGLLMVDADVGDITVTGTDSDQVVVMMRARGSDEMLSRFDISMDQEGNTVKVKARQKGRFFSFFHNNSLDVKFDIRVPKSFNLDLHTAGGDLAVESVKGKIDGQTSGGDLDLSSVEGTVTMSTSGGNVDVRSSSGNLRLETSGGEIRGESLTGSMHLETSGGNITIRDSDGQLYASTSGGNINVALKDNKGVDLSTSGGNVVLKLPNSIQADVRAETTGGDVSCDFQFMGKLKDGSMHGKINGGGKEIRLETTGGDIMISTL